MNRFRGDVSRVVRKKCSRRHSEDDEDKLGGKNSLSLLVNQRGTHIFLYLHVYALPRTLWPHRDARLSCVGEWRRWKWKKYLFTCAHKAWSDLRYLMMVGRELWGGNRRGIGKDSFFGIDTRRKKIFHGEMDDSESARSLFITFIIIIPFLSPSWRPEQGLLLIFLVFFYSQLRGRIKAMKKIIQIVLC